MNVTKLLFILLGTLSLFVGLLGIIIPGLPATPFLLITAGLYAKSSQKLYNRLISNKIIGPHILEFRKSRGMTLKLKLISIFTMWIMTAISVIFYLEDPVMKVMIPAFAFLGTLVLLFIVRTVDISKK